MKQTINILAFFFVLSIPFALSSQTRKAIPAGRYEALSGIKNSRAMKSSDTQINEKKDSTSLFWNEVLNHVPENSKLSYFSTGKVDDATTNILSTKGVKAAKKLKGDTSIIISDDLKRDKEILSSMKNKNSLVVLKDSQDLKNVMTSLGQYEVLLYQAEDKSNYFLLKLK
ncbi:MAG: hypothetical protein H7336_05600 [Bacteriovorax sp.]|nr:hypothetical protein [Bacteriovorax sp.]